ncbi:hypothetical protein N0V90_002185 [Kalmusia sp. IMI 367209]|nr:hypothetical protein N0V90_002185 [Kalmusia sp. IMI 367209]
MSLRIVSLGFLASAIATPLNNVARNTCNPCNPQGASGSNPPSVGPDLKSLYLDILESVKDIHFEVEKRWADPVDARDDVFCCQETLDCVKVQNLNIPMCYDKFTTNYAFPDRSYGSLTTGDYTQGEDKANLLTGQFTKDGSEGNIYSDDTSAKPNTATLSVPPQWTGSGVGSAIPPTAIASVAPMTTTASSQTSDQTTAAESAQSSGKPTATAASAASQPTGSTTATSVESSAAASASPSQGAAAQGRPAFYNSFAMSFFTAFMYTFYAL